MLPGRAALRLPCSAALRGISQDQPTPSRAEFKSPLAHHFIGVIVLVTALNCRSTSV